MSKLTESARGRDCTLMIYPYCNMDPEKTTLAHIGSERKGTAIKSPDYFGVFACSTCHDIIDAKRYVDLPDVEIQKCINRALYRTWKIWIEEGFISINVEYC